MSEAALPRQKRRAISSDGWGYGHEQAICPAKPLRNARGRVKTLLAAVPPLKKSLHQAHKQKMARLAIHHKADGKPVS